MYKIHKIRVITLKYDERIVFLLILLAWPVTGRCCPSLLRTWRLTLAGWRLSG